MVQKKDYSGVWPGVFLTLMLVTFVVFTILKLAGVIAWSWWWVTVPLWVTLATILVSFFISFHYVVKQVRKHNEMYNSKK